MSAKPVEIFQGSDWLTYRWSVAQVFDTLDRIRDLCLQMPVLAPPPGTAAAAAPRYEMPAEDVADLFGTIADLTDDLSADLQAVQADLSQALRHNLGHRWLAFEMELHTAELRRRALKQAASDIAPAASPETIAVLAGRIKALLKQIDQ